MPTGNPVALHITLFLCFVLAACSQNGLNATPTPPPGGVCGLLSNCSFENPGSMPNTLEDWTYDTDTQGTLVESVPGQVQEGRMALEVIRGPLSPPGVVLSLKQNPISANLVYNDSAHVLTGWIWSDPQAPKPELLLEAQLTPIPDSPGLGWGDLWGMGSRSSEFIVPGEWTPFAIKLFPSTYDVWDFEFRFDIIALDVESWTIRLDGLHLGVFEE